MKVVILIVSVLMTGCGMIPDIHMDFPLRVIGKTQTTKGCYLDIDGGSSVARWVRTSAKPEYCVYEVGQEIK